MQQLCLKYSKQEGVSPRSEIGSTLTPSLCLLYAILSMKGGFVLLLSALKSQTCQLLSLRWALMLVVGFR